MAKYWQHLARWIIPTGVASLLSFFLLKQILAVVATPSSSQQTTTLRTWKSPQDLGKQWLTPDRQLAGLVYEPLPELPHNQASTQVDTVRTKPATKPHPQPDPAASQQQHSTKHQKTAKSSPKKTTPAKTSIETTIRVAIATKTVSLTVGTSTTAVAVDDQGRLIGKINAGEGAIANSSGAAIQLGNWEAPASVWLQPADNGVVYVGDRWYRGVVRLIREGDRLLAINYVQLEDYLYSVVGAEMPAYWPLEALKAQAVAARSYAIVHIIRPAHTHYDLGATTRWQAYEGIKAESNVSQTAVEATRGLFLSYQGGVVESLYAASDQLVVDVHGGSGMSQQGAYKLSQQQHDYQQILATYYPNTQIAQLQ